MNEGKNVRSLNFGKCWRIVFSCNSLFPSSSAVYVFNFSLRVTRCEIFGILGRRLQVLSTALPAPSAGNSLKFSIFTFRSLIRVLSFPSNDVTWRPENSNDIQIHRRLVYRETLRRFQWFIFWRVCRFFEIMMTMYTLRKLVRNLFSNRSSPLFH